MKEVKMGMGRSEVRFLLYADYLTLCGESEEDLSSMEGYFVEVCWRRGLRVNTSKSKVWH